MKLLQFPENVVQITEGKEAAEAIILLKQFIDVSVIQDKNKQIEAYTELREAIYDFLPDYHV